MAILIGASVLLAIGVVVVLRRRGAGSPSYETVVLNDLATAKRRIDSIQSLARALRTNPQARDVFVAANSISIEMTRLIDTVQRDMSDWNMLGLELEAISSIEETLRGLVGVMRDLPADKLREELSKTLRLLEEKTQSFVAAREKLTANDRTKMDAHRSAANVMLGTSISVEVPNPANEDEAPPRRKAQEL